MELYRVNITGGIAAVEFHDSYLIVSEGMKKAIDKAEKIMKEHHEMVYMDVKKVEIVEDLVYIA